MKKLISVIFITGTLLLIATPQVEAAPDEDIIVKPMSGGSSQPPVNGRP